MATEKTSRIVVITAPERIEQDWISRLANETDIARVDRVGVVTAGIDLVQQNRPDIVIIDRDLEQTEACIRQIFMSLPSTQCIAIVPHPDVPTLRRLVTAGARDVLGRPVHYLDLLTSVRAVVATEADRRARALVPVASDQPHFGRGRLIVVTSPKGGTGVTTIATNLAVALRQMSGGRVLLADFGLQFGDVGVHLNLWSKFTLQDLLSRADDIDDALLNSVLQRHSSGVHVLLAPNSPEVAGDITGNQIETLLDKLLERHTYVLVDTWSFLDEIAATLLRRADEVVVVSTPEVPALKNIKHFMSYNRQQNIIQGRISLVINRFPSVNGIALDDVQQHLRHPVSANIPSDGQLVTHSVNRGVPIVLSNAQSWVGQSMMKLAAHLAGEQVNALSMTPEPVKTRNRGKMLPAPAAAKPAKERRGLLSFIRREAKA